MPKKKKVKKKVISKKPKETIYKTKKEWISKATVNKSQYTKKYNESIKDNDGSVSYTHLTLPTIYSV